jgi:hypothetical protein
LNVVKVCPKKESLILINISCCVNEPRAVVAGTHEISYQPERGLRKPNFFIIGASKCGTTSLCRWLSEHPNVFICPEKEPHFFNTDDVQRGTSTLGKYEALFAGVKKEHTAIGEASVWYLSSSAAVPNILAYQPDTKFIVMVRSPLQMAPALHAQVLLGA